MEAAREAQGPGHAGVARDGAAVRQLGAREKPHQRRLARAVGPDDRGVAAHGKVEVNVLEDGLATAFRGVGLGDVDEADHGR